MYAYIDESGDTGMTNKSSKNFILTCIAIDDERKVKNKIKKLLQKVLKSNKKHSHYFHAYKESEVVRNKLIELIFDNVISIECIVINKKYTDLYKGTLDKLLNALATSHAIDKVFIASYDKRKSTIRRYESDSRFIVKFTTPQNETVLQIADMVSWSLYQSFENDNNIWLNKIKQECIVQIQQNP